MGRMNRMREQSRGPVPRTTKKARLLNRSARAYPSHAPQPLHIKVLADLSLLFLLMSIDIKGLRTLGPYSKAASHPANPDNPAPPASDS